ncbi:MAG: ABC transporter permease [bacterium]|nr:ABC transporter permease [bacterium]
MQVFFQMLTLNLKRRMREGFALGYNIIFPIIFILVLGAITRGMFGNEISSFQYYSVVMPLFCLCLGIVTIAYAGKDDAYQNTAYRIMAAPVQPKIIVAAKIVSGTIVLVSCSMIVSVGAIFFCHIPLTGDFIFVILLIMTLSLLISAVGTLIGLSMKNFMIIKNIISFPICIFGIVGGAFFRFGTSDAILQFLINCSPLTWINRACFLALFDHNTELIKEIIVGVLILCVVVTAFSVKCFKKEEYIYGNLPGYEK